MQTLNEYIFQKQLDEYLEEIEVLDESSFAVIAALGRLVSKAAVGSHEQALETMRKLVVKDQKGGSKHDISYWADKAARLYRGVHWKSLLAAYDKVYGDG